MFHSDFLLIYQEIKTLTFPLSVRLYEACWNDPTSCSPRGVNFCVVVCDSLNAQMTGKGRFWVLCGFVSPFHSTVVSLRVENQWNWRLPASTSLNYSVTFAKNELSE